MWPQQGQHACNNEAAEHQVVKKGRGASYESPPPPAIPPRHPRNNPVPPPPPPGFEPRPSGNNPANSTTIPPINNATAIIKEDKSSTNQANGRSKGAPTLHRQAKSFKYSPGMGSFYETESDIWSGLTLPKSGGWGRFCPLVIFL